MLKQRILTALVLLPLMIGMLFWANASLWAAFSGLIALLALWEYARIIHMSPLQNTFYLLITASAGILFYLQQPTFSAILLQVIQITSLLFWLLVVPLWLKYKWKIKSKFVGTIIGWVLMVPFWLALVNLRPDANSAWALLAIMALVWIADIAAYCCGRTLGKHKLAPTISPNKSWEGAIGAVVFVAIYTFILQQQYWLSVALPLWQTLLIALILTIVSIVGDLLESWLKRAAGIKDSSQLLPGHGGVFDRVDSMISVLSVYVALHWLALL